MLHEHDLRHRACSTGYADRATILNSYGGGHAAR
jgi:hypothetical protein